MIAAWAREMPLCCAISSTRSAFVMWAPLKNLDEFSSMPDGTRIRKTGTPWPRRAEGTWDGFPGRFRRRRHSIGAGRTIPRSAGTAAPVNPSDPAATRSDDCNAAQRYS